MAENPDVPICQQCSQQHLTPKNKPSCNAHITSGERKGEPCRNEPGKGTGTHVGYGNCRFHGGLTPNANKHAQKEMLDDEVRRQLGLNEWEAIEDPYTALADHVGKGQAIEAILLQKVEELASLRQYGGQFGERIDVIFEAWERAYRQMSSDLLGMARLDLDDKIARLRAKVDLATAEIVSRALAGALGTVELSAEQRESVLKEFGERLRPAAPLKIAASLVPVDS